MNIKTIGIFAALIGVLAMPAVYADDDFAGDVMEEVEYQDYEDYEVFDDVEDLIDEELSESVEYITDAEDGVAVEVVETATETEAVESEVVDVPAPRAVADRLSCDEINIRVEELRTDVKSYPDLRADLEYMLSRQRNQCAPRAARRPVHNYKNVNPVMDVEVPEAPVAISQEPPLPEKTPEEIAAEEAAAEEARLAKIEENRAKGLCDDGEKPNRYGCCAGEMFKQLEHLDFACCPKEGDGDCVAPRKK